MEIFLIDMGKLRGKTYKESLLVDHLSSKSHLGRGDLSWENTSIRLSPPTVDTTKLKDIVPDCIQKQADWTSDRE